MGDIAARRKTILLLVPDAAVRVVLQEILAEADYVVVSSGDLGHAVDRLREVSPDLLITRTYVHSMTGHDTAKYLRTKCTTMKVLILGGHLDDDRLQFPDTLRGFNVFPKPYSAAELHDKVKEILGSTK